MEKYSDYKQAAKSASSQQQSVTPSKPQMPSQPRRTSGKRPSPTHLEADCGQSPARKRTKTSRRPAPIPVEVDEYDESGTEASDEGSVGEGAYEEDIDHSSDNAIMPELQFNPLQDDPMSSACILLSSSIGEIYLLLICRPSVPLSHHCQKRPVARDVGLLFSARTPPALLLRWTSPLAPYDLRS